MPNLVGIGLSQVPTNSMLGGLAYQDPEHASIKNLDLKNLSQINSEIADTAVDVFVYDTSKDSDGGDWRKRTQNTSWYNETLNTSTRGSRKEFPAVAVIVAETTKVTIYDGDDPDLPMWMVFTWSGASVDNLLGYNDRAKSAITAVNGYLITCSDPDGIHIARFIHDDGIRYTHTNHVYTSDSIANRTNTVYRVINATSLLVASTCNDIAATVLPNAPIDDTTGLPVPTIAVATDSGVSVIKDDGNVFDVIDSNGGRKCYDVSFTKDHKIMYTGDLGAGGTHAGNVFVTNVLTADRAEYDNHGDLYRWYSTSAMYPRINGGNTYNTRVLDPLDVGGHHYAMADVGISLIEDGTSSSYGNTDGMVAYIASDYNTGYMHGDIKGAFLSDTTVESLTANTNLATSAIAQGTNRLSSHTYDSGDTSWSMVDASGTSNGYVNIGLKGLTIGQSYFISMTWDGNTALDAGYEHRIAHLNGTAGENPTDFTHWNKTNGSAETLTGVFIAQSVNDDDLIIYCNNMTLNISNFNVRVVDDEDRSIKNKGLAVFGTVTKSAVATGAELVAYSGFSASNYLKQPYNSDLAPGTAAYSVSCWFKTGTSSGDQYIFDRNGGGAGSRNLLLIMNTSAGNANEFQFWHRDNNGNVTDIQITDKTITDNVWHQVVALNDGTNYRVYVDGEVSSVTSSQIRNVISDNNPPMFVGIRHSGGSTFMTGSMALFRYSKSAPSPEQIKKMYEDEKVLFQENAKATLYGSSDAVTALAFDDTTNLLHVGTSAGRSEFQGLSRINNTTDAVTTAISASNGLVAEQ